jgi:hypothetical protein
MHRRAFIAAGVATLLGGRHALSHAADGASGRSDADAYAPLGEVAVDGTKEAVVSSDGTTAYLAVTDGFAVVDVSDPADPAVIHERRDLLADRVDGPLRRVWDVALADDHLVVASQDGEGGDLYAFAVYDVSDPANPERRLTRDVEGPIHNCDLADGHVYVTELHDGHHSDTGAAGLPVGIYDVRSEGAPKVAEWSPVEKNPAWADVPARNRLVHDVSVVSGRAYLAYWDAGAFLLDVSDPAEPTVLSRVGEFTAGELAAMSESELAAEAIEGPAGNAHYVTGSADGSVFAVGKEAWDDPDTEGGAPGGIDLYDASDPTDPRKQATIAPERAPDETPGGVTTTAHNFEIRGDRLYSSWYRAGVKIHDISDPGSPELLARWLRPREASFWTAQVGVPGEFFVASSASGASGGLPASREALLTFPDRAGEQADRPSLSGVSPTATPTEAPPTTETPPATTTAPPGSPPGGSTGSGDGPPATGDTPATPVTPGPATRGSGDVTTGPSDGTTGPADGTTESGDGTTTATGGQSGVGVLGALAGIAIGVYRYLRAE